MAHMWYFGAFQNNIKFCSIKAGKIEYHHGKMPINNLKKYKNDIFCQFRPVISLVTKISSSTFMIQF